jgi:hypothetical protein
VIIGAFFSDLHTSLQLNKKKDMQPAKGYVHLFFALAVQAKLGPIPSLSRRTLMHPPMPWL